MANYSALKATIDANIKSNGVQAITGPVLNGVLNDMVTALGDGYVYKGIATTSTNPGSPDGNVYYLAQGAGTYTNFGGIAVTDNEVAILSWNGSSWSKVVTPAATSSQVSQLDLKVDEIGQEFYGEKQFYVKGNAGQYLNTIDFSVLKNTSFLLSIKNNGNSASTVSLSVREAGASGFTSIGNISIASQSIDTRQVVLAYDIEAIRVTIVSGANELDITVSVGSIADRVNTLAHSSSIFNVTDNVPLSSGYYTDESARLAVPREIRKNGLVILYAVNANDWHKQIYYKTGVTDYSDATWKSELSWVHLPIPTSSYFSSRTIALNPSLSSIKKVSVKTLSKGVSLPDHISLLELSQGNVENQRIILNLNHSVANNAKVQTIVIPVTVTDYSNVEFSAEKDGVLYTIVADRREFLSAVNLQSISSEWADITSYQYLPYTLNGLPLFNNYLTLVRTIGDNFFLDVQMTTKEVDGYTYFPYIIDINYGGQNMITLARKNVNSETYEAVHSLLVDDYISSSGIVEFCGVNNYSSVTPFVLYLKLDWSVVRDRYDGQRLVFYHNNAAFSSSVFRREKVGGVQMFDLKSTMQLPYFSEGNYQLGSKIVRKMDDNDVPMHGTVYQTDAGRLQQLENMQSWCFDGKGVGGKLKGLQYVDLSTSLVFLDITWDGKVWFGRRENGNLRYYPSVADVIANTNYTELPTGTLFLNNGVQQIPYGLKMNDRGELIVISWNYLLGISETENTPRIWKSDSNFANFSLVQTAKTSQVGFAYPDWLFAIDGDRVLVTFYGGHIDDASRAAWHIYYSMDGGATWYNNLFELGNMVDVDGWTETSSAAKAQMHIHGVSIDSYRHALMVQSGDSNPSLWVTTNLEDWENDSARRDAWSQNSAHTLHWKRIATRNGAKYTSAIALKDCILLGTDSLPNGFERLPRIAPYYGDNELALSDKAWVNQRELAGGTGDYGYYGYTLSRRSPCDPVLCSIIYVGGVQSEDYKRNMVYATYDGYTFWKLWEDDRDVVCLRNGTLSPLQPRTNVIARQSSDGYVLIQTLDSRFNAPVNGYPAPTTDLTLVVGRL